MVWAASGDRSSESGVSHRLIRQAQNKGRTPRSLLRQVTECEATLGLAGKRPGLRWPGSGIDGLRLTEPGVAGRGLRVWTIRELRTAAELRAEGNAMHHCVGEYLVRCPKRQTSIWSVVVEGCHGWRRVLTIEVDPVKRRRT
jgi:hypothetical protein